MFGKLRAAALAAVVLSFGAMTVAPASALTLQGRDCTTASLEGATRCAGIFTGNDANQNLDGLFGLDGWTAIEKIDAASGSSNSNGLNLVLTATSGAKSGTWKIDSYGGFDPVMFVLKGGPSFSAFLMDLTTLTGDWDTQSVVKGNGKPGPGLSHVTVYQAGISSVLRPGTTSVQRTSTAAVPLPAAGWLLIAGLGGLGAMGWRRRAAARGR